MGFRKIPSLILIGKNTRHGQYKHTYEKDAFNSGRYGDGKTVKFDFAAC